jgi:hypothetical protein
MRDAAFLVAALIVVYLGFALLAVSQDRHWHHLGGARHCPTRASMLLRIGGCALLIAALILLLVSDGAGFGSLLWATMLSIGAVAVVGTLTWRPGWLRPLARLVRCLT